jgi:hypothetical protein
LLVVISAEPCRQGLSAQSQFRRLWFSHGGFDEGREFGHDRSQFRE